MCESPLPKSLVRGLLLYDFKSGVKAAESSRRICAAFGDGVMSERTAQDWFKRFREGDTSLEDRPRSGRPAEVDDERLRQIVEADPHQTSRELATILGVSHFTIIEHLHAMGKTSRLDQWVPHKLSDVDRQRRADAAASLLSHHGGNAWLDSIVTGDEKWCCYVNEKRRRSWTDKGSQTPIHPRPSLHPRKIMLSVWWDSSGVIHWELLPANSTITAVKYCEQLDRLAAKISELRPEKNHVRFLHDNARPHVARLTRQKMLDLGWEVLTHPPYSPDLAPSDYHLFSAMSNALAGTSFDDEHEMSLWLTEFFTSKSAQFYRTGIHSLPVRWRKVIDSDGDYIVH